MSSSTGSGWNGWRLRGSRPRIRTAPGASSPPPSPPVWPAALRRSRRSGTPRCSSRAPSARRSPWGRATAPQTRCTACGRRRPGNRARGPRRFLDVKQMRDGVLSATAADGTIRAVAVVSTQTVEDARIRHTTSATATAALGRSLTAAALLGAGLKDGQSVLLRVLGDGPIGAVIAQANAEGHVRGYAVHPHADLPQTDHRKLDVGGLVGRNGTLHITRDVGLRTAYHGSAPLVSGEIAEDLASYLVTSEQIPSVVALGVLVGPDLRVLASGGLCIQVLPGTQPGVVDGLEARARQLPPITQTITMVRTLEES